MTAVASAWSEIPVPAYSALPAGTAHADVAVIGGGLTGLSAAHHLLASRPGARVVLLESERIGAGASGRTTGMLGPGVGQSYAALVRRVGPAKAEATYRATLRAVEYTRDLIREEGIDCELAMTGQLVLARSNAARRRLAAQAALFAGSGIPHDTLNDSELAGRIRLSPAPGDRGPAALRLPVAGVLHPMKLVAGLAERIVARGGRIFESTRVTAMSGRRPVRIATQGGGEVLADEVVAATAAYTQDLGLLRGRILPLHLQVLVTEPLDGDARAAIGWEGREGVLDARRIFSYFRLTSDERIVFGGGMPRYRWGGATEDGGAAGALDELRLELHRIFPAAARLQVARGWTGVIDYVADALPAIQRSKHNAAIVHVVGWCGHGIALAVASGEWVAALMAGETGDRDLPWFRNDPPLIAPELVRWVGFQSSVQWMSWLDRTF